MYGGISLSCSWSKGSFGLVLIKSTVLQLYIFMAVSYILSYHVQATPQLIINWLIQPVKIYLCDKQTLHWHTDVVTSG